MPPPSHSYDFASRDLITTVGLSLIPLLAFALLMHFGASRGILPPPQAILDADRTILLHQAQASRSPQIADMILIGDSSCLMDVSADQLSCALPGAHSALNLGTLSYLDLDAFSSLLQHYLAANPGRLRAVVLLMNPEALRRLSPSDYHIQALERYFSGADLCDPDLPPVLCSLGVDTWRGRVLSRAVPQPLPGALGQTYGFTRDLWNYLSTHHGSAIDPGNFNPAAAQGNAEYRLAKSLQPASQKFRASLPAGVKLFVGVTPLPESFGGPNFVQVHRQLLLTWSQWLKADAALTNLPASLPDGLFAGITHLNSNGVVLYTDGLAHALEGEALP
jgi:hypothetical protein